MLRRLACSLLPLLPTVALAQNGPPTSAAMVAQPPEAQPLGELKAMLARVRLRLSSSQAGPPGSGPARAAAADAAAPVMGTAQIQRDLQVMARDRLVVGQHRRLKARSPLGVVDVDEVLAAFVVALLVVGAGVIETVVAGGGGGSCTDSGGPGLSSSKPGLGEVGFAAIKMSFPFHSLFITGV